MVTTMITGLSRIQLRVGVGRLLIAVGLACAVSVVLHGALQAQAGASATTVRAQARPNPTPAWGKGIQPISQESYYNAIECGKQGVADPPCVFWDNNICKNDDFTLAWYTPYKQVAYQVWAAVSRKQPVPQPNYQAASRANVTIGVTPVKGGKNTLKEVVLKRAGKPAIVIDRSLSNGGGRYTFPTAAFAPSAAVVVEMLGSERTISCTFSPAVLRQMR